MASGNDDETKGCQGLAPAWPDTPTQSSNSRFTFKIEIAALLCAVCMRCTFKHCFSMAAAVGGGSFTAQLCFFFELTALLCCCFFSPDQGKWRETEKASVPPLESKRRYLSALFLSQKHRPAWSCLVKVSKQTRVDSLLQVSRASAAKYTSMPSTIDEGGYFDLKSAWQEGGKHLVILDACCDTAAEPKEWVKDRQRLIQETTGLSHP